MRIYIAGPYTKGDVVPNVRAAIEAGDKVAALGHVPFVPYLTHFWHMLIPHEYEFWMAQDLEWLKVCDAILRLPGESSGADKEVGEAQKLGLRLFFSIENIPRENVIK